MRQYQYRRACFSALVPVILLTSLPLLLSAHAAGPAAGQMTGAKVEKGIVLLIAFPDVRNDVDRRFVEKRFNQQLNDYVKEVSHHRVSLAADVTKKWY
jgi:hypothetical protein